MRGYFTWQCIQQRGKCLIIFPSRLGGVWFFSLSQSRSPDLRGETRNKSENANWKRSQLWLWLGEAALAGCASKDTAGLGMNTSVKCQFLLR